MKTPARIKPGYSTLKALATEAGLAPATAAKILRDAGLVELSGRRFPHAPAIAALNAGLDPSLEIGHALVGRNAPASPLTGLADAKSRAEIARAAKLELEIATKTGRLVERAAVDRAVADMIARSRTAMLSLPLQLAADLINISDPHRIADVLDNGIRRALGHLSETMVEELLA